MKKIFNKTARMQEIRAIIYGLMWGLNAAPNGSGIAKHSDIEGALAYYTRELSSLASLPEMAIAP